MYSKLLAYDEICKGIYRDKQRINEELVNTETAKACAQLKVGLSALVTKNKQLMAELNKLNAEYQECVKKYSECLKNFNMEAEDFDGRKDDADIESDEFEECRKELEKLRNTSRKLEQSMMYIAKRADEIATAIDSNTVEGRKKNKQYKTAQEKMSEEKSARESEIKALDEKRKEAAKTVDKDLREPYDRIFEANRDPIAYVSNGRCDGCNMTLPLSMLEKVTANELILCENCGRMIIGSK